MAKERLTHRLPQPRVSEKLFNLVHNVAAAQELDVADVIRLALEDYCAPRETVQVPVIGTLTKDGVKLSHDYLALYLEVEPVGGA